MSRKLKRLLLYMAIAILPLCMKFFCAVFMGENVKFVKLISEICCFDIMICAYTIVSFLAII